jgi:two-component system OmpR family sensor kinase
MSLPGGIRVKLTLALAAIVGGALLSAYLIVVPSLERSLVDAKLEQLHANADTIASALAGSGALSSPAQIELSVRGYSEAFGARVVVLRVDGPSALTVVSDSAESTTGAMAEDPVALEAARTGRSVRARVGRGEDEYGEAAVQLLPTNGIVLVSASLADQLATVRLVERRMLYAMAAAMGIAVALGFLAATIHARRIRRLQRAANRIAERHFDEPIVDKGDDELGELASAFDRMRVEVAQLDSARKEFVANASHELRTPLFSLSGFLELLEDEELDEETRRSFLATTRGQVERLTKLATDLLDLSRMDAGRLRIDADEMELTETARLLAEELHALVEASRHTLDVVGNGEAWAHADEERVLQIGRALAGNALVHTPGGTRVLLRAERRGDRAILAVEDDGPGIPAEHLERVFQRFYRVEGAHASGSGLGLAIAREIAEHMGGSVTIESRPGRTVCTLDLPGEPQPA